MIFCFFGCRGSSPSSPGGRSRPPFRPPGNKKSFSRPDLFFFTAFLFRRGFAGKSGFCAAPADFPQVHSSSGIKMDPFSFQQFSLAESPVPPGPGADLSPGVDDPLPGNIGPSPQRGHGIPDHSGRAPVHDFRDLPIGDNSALWNPSYRAVNSFINRLDPGILSAVRPSGNDPA
jgi:hypothetical protein